MIRGILRRWTPVATTALILAAFTCAPSSVAIPPPTVDPAMVPSDDPPGPARPMRQSRLCASTIALAEPRISRASAGFEMLDIAAAWRYSTGNGVPVAVVDTGVTPNRRLPVVPGGDYIGGGDGLIDCDAHGTVVASVIAAAPQGVPAPRPMPPQPAFPSPAFAVTRPETRTESRPETRPETTGESGPTDGVVGVAPHATIISIRRFSRAYEPLNLLGEDADGKQAGALATLARAVVHAANLGAKVITIAVAECLPTVSTLDQRAVGAAVWYASTVKDAVVVAATGNQGEDGCGRNPAAEAVDAAHSPDGRQTATISSPSWFTDYVLSVGSVGATGAFAGTSLTGPWVGVAAPAESVAGLSPADGSAVNAYSPVRPGESAVPFRGNSFATAFVSGVVALVRARFPKLTASQVVHRIQQTAHNPARGVDDEVGYGLVDPVAALTFDVGPGDQVAPGAAVDTLASAAVPAPPDRRARTAAVSFVVAITACVLLASIVARARRAR